MGRKRKKLTEVEKWQRKADRINAKRREEAGLFADLVELTTGEAEKARHLLNKERAAQHLQRLQEALRLMQEKADAAREEVRKLVTAEEFQRLERRRAICPPSAEYAADIWCGALRKLQTQQGNNEAPR